MVRDQSKFSLTGKAVLVTGGAGRLGAAMCAALAEAGAHVWVNGRDERKVDALVEDLRKANLTAFPLPFDITSETARERALASLSRLDVLVNNASPIQTGTIDTVEAIEFHRVSSVVVDAAYAMVKASLPLLRASRGSILNVASMYGVVSPDPRIYGQSGSNNPPQYGAAKAALIQLTRYLACHLAPDGIRANCICPGPFPPRDVLQASQPGFLSALESRVPLGRCGRPEEIGGAVVFLSSDAASYITGTSLPIDGGWTAW